MTKAPTKRASGRRRDAGEDDLAQVVAREDRAEMSVGIGETTARRIVRHLLEKAFHSVGLDELAAERRAQDIADEIEDVYNRQISAGRGALLRASSGGLAKRGKYRVPPARVRAAVDARKEKMGVNGARDYVARNSEKLFGQRISLSKVKADSSSATSQESKRSLHRPRLP